jgi:hypothetical protein
MKEEALYQIIIKIKTISDLYRVLEDNPADTETIKNFVLENPEICKLAIISTRSQYKSTLHEYYLKQCLEYIETVLLVEEEFSKNAIKCACDLFNKENDKGIFKKTIKRFLNRFNNPDPYAAIIQQFFNKEILRLAVNNTERLLNIAAYVSDAARAQLNALGFPGVASIIEDHRLDIAAQISKVKYGVIAYLLKDKKIFQQVINSEVALYEVIKEFPALTDQIIKQVLSSKEIFKQILKNVNDLSNAVAHYPAHAGDFVNCVLDKKVFKDVIKSVSDLRQAVENLPDFSAKIVDFILKDPELFLANKEILKDVIGSASDLRWIVENHPDCADVIIAHLLKDKALFKHVIDVTSSLCQVVKNSSMRMRS